MRVWTAVKYGCSLLNERLGKRVFRVRSTDLRRDDVRELIEKAVEKRLNLPKSFLESSLRL